jgi:hypothetical protein
VLDTLIESVPKMEEMVGPVSTNGRELLREWQWVIGLIVSFMIFTASAWKILDTTLYMVITDTWHTQTNMTACMTKKLFLHLWIFLFWRVSFYLSPVVKNYHTNISYWYFSVQGHICPTKAKKQEHAQMSTQCEVCVSTCFKLHHTNLHLWRLWHCTGKCGTCQHT